MENINAKTNKKTHLFGRGGFPPSVTGQGGGWGQLVVVLSPAYQWQAALQIIT